MKIFQKPSRAGKWLLCLLICMHGVFATGCKGDDPEIESPLAPATVKKLISPSDGAVVNVEEVDDVTFIWEAAEKTATGEITYRVLFYKPGAAEPFYTCNSDNNGKDAKAVVPKNKLLGMSRTADTRADEGITIMWRIRTVSSGKTALSEVSNSVVLTGAQTDKYEPFEVGTPLYMAGAGSEEGQRFRFVDGPAPYYEIYTRLNEGKPYYFRAVGDNADWLFAVDKTGSGIEEVTTASSTANATAVYRIKLDFAEQKATFGIVEQVVVRMSAKNTNIALTYVGNGAWKVLNYNVVCTNESWTGPSDPPENRYKFILTVDGAAEHWGFVTGDYPNSTPGIEIERITKQVATGQWDGTYKYPTALCDKNNLSRYYTDLVLNMNVLNETYTHHFEKWYDSETYYGGKMSPPADWKWSMAADSCTFTLVDQFLNKTKGTFWGSPNNVLNNTNGLYWQQAYPMHTMLYSYLRNKDSNPSLAADYRSWFSLWIANNGNNWYSTKRNGFYNEYTDDMGWIALVFVHMYEVFGDESYLTKAREIYGYMTEPERIDEDSSGWGLIWKLTDRKRNVCTNSPAMLLSAKLYNITNEQAYLDNAFKLHDYLHRSGKMKDDGRVDDPPLTYTQGTQTEGCRLLFHITGDTKYRDEAELCIKCVMGSRCVNAGGVLRDEGSDPSNYCFKAGLMPYMVNFILDETMPSETREQARVFLMHNARILWFHNMDKSLYPKTFANYSFNTRYIVEGNPGLMGVHNCAAAMLEGVARMTE